MLEWFKIWRRREALKKIARRMGPLLRKHCGLQEYYAQEQVLETARRSGFDQESARVAVAMFVHPDQAQVDAKLTRELKALREKTSGSDSIPDGGSDYNMFMHFPSGSSDGGPGQDASGGHSHGSHGHGGHSCSSHSCGGHSCSGGH
jgi:hypothetical protein